MEKDQKQVGLNDDLAAEIERKSDAAESGASEAAKAAEEFGNAEHANTSPEPEETSRAKKKKETSAGKIVGIVFACVFGVALIVGGFLYYTTAKKYETIYYPNTEINGINASYKTPQQVKDEIALLCQDYALVFKSRGREDEVITAPSVGMHYVTDDTPDRILAEQQPFTWFLHINAPKTYKLTTTAEVDDVLFDEVCSGLKAFDDKSCVLPVDAKLGGYDSGRKEYVIIPETDGNRIDDKDSVKQLIRQSMITFEPELNIDAEPFDFYPKAGVTSENEALKAEQYKFNRFVKTKVVIKGSDEVLDGDRINAMLETAEDGSLRVNEEKLKTYVSELAAKYNTLEATRSFVTHDGKRATVLGGTYGFQLDEEGELEALRPLCEAGEEVEHELVFKQKGASLTGPDFGNSYVEVSIEDQHVYVYKDGFMIMDTPCVTGLASNKLRATPEGTYFVYFKQTDRTLHGELRPDGTYEYSSHVNYWMPFNKGVGLHDATWRGSFGGDIYKYNGSHGCINLPFNFAKKLYSEIEVGFPVIVYGSSVEDPTITVKPEEQTLPETEPETTKAPETKKATKAATKAPAQPPVPQTAAVPQTTPETLPVAIPWTPPEVPESTAPPVTGVHGGPGVTLAQ